MAKTIEIKYFNSFWIKKVVPVEAASNEEYNADYPSGSNNPGLPIGNQAANAANNNDYWNANISGYWVGLPWRPAAISPAGEEGAFSNPLQSAMSQYPPFAWYNAPRYGINGVGYSKPGTIHFYSGVQYNNDNINFASNWYIEEATHKGGFNNNRCSSR